RFVDRHPDTGSSVVGMRVPYWGRVLDLSRRVAEAVGLGYIGVGIVGGEGQGPVLLEGNARPGLAIQIAKRPGVLPRLEEIDKELDEPAEAYKPGVVGKVRVPLRRSA